MSASVLLFLLPLVFAGKPFKECIWNGTVAAMEENCTKITGPNITFNNEDIKILYSKLSYVEEVNGCVQVIQSPYERLDFFARLRTVTCNQAGVAVDFNVANNTALKRLGMPVLRVPRLGLASNPQLCLSPEEQQRFTYVQRTPGENATTCMGRNGPIRECSSQQGQPNAGLGDDCEIVMGSLFIDGTNNPTIGTKLQYIKEISGRLYVRNTNLVNLSLPLLDKVYAADAVPSSTNDPAIVVTGNTNLTTIALPELDFITKSEYSLVADGPFVLDQDMCGKMAKYGTAKNNATVCVGSHGGVSYKIPFFVALLFAVFKYF